MAGENRLYYGGVCAGGARWRKLVTRGRFLDVPLTNLRPGSKRGQAPLCGAPCGPFGQRCLTPFRPRPQEAGSFSPIQGGSLSGRIRAAACRRAETAVQRPAIASGKAGRIGKIARKSASIHGIMSAGSRMTGSHPPPLPLRRWCCWKRTVAGSLVYSGTAPPTHRSGPPGTGSSRAAKWIAAEDPR